MPKLEVSRTLVKSPPELWPDLSEGRLAEAVGCAEVAVTESERSVRWEAQGVRGTASLEPSGWGTKVTLRAHFEEQVAESGRWGRWRGRGAPAEPPRHVELEQRLESLLDDLGSDHRKPFTRG
ncbi:MAG: hypothetical protein M3375_04715 [Actinomycetota bacterium]|nr:hypothetical protein [Actinomycetota bacterium]